MNILVTGGSGFIGSALIKRLAGEVDNVDLVVGKDIRTYDFKKYDLVYHLAALRSVPLSFDQDREYFDTNVYGTFRVLDKCSNARIVNISTSSAPNPIAPYGLSKLLAEKIAERYDNVVSLRLFNPFGEAGGTDLVIPIFADAMVNNDQVYIHSDGNQSRDFTYLADVVEEILYYGNSKETGVKQVGYGESHTVNEVFDIMRKYFDYTKEPVFLPKRRGDQVHTQAQDKLHIKPIGFYEGLERTMRWYR